MSIQQGDPIPEWFNPGGAVKDRPASRMVEEGERSGALTPEKIILDASSGNTGIAYAWIGAVKGYRVQRAVPGNVSQERMGMEELAEEYAGQLMDITFLYWEECLSYAETL